MGHLGFPGNGRHPFKDYRALLNGTLFLQCIERFSKTWALFRTMSGLDS